MLLFRCSWFSTSINWISLQLKFFLHFSRALGREVEIVILSKQIPLARASSAIDALLDAQKMCAVTKLGTVLKSLFSFTPPI